MVFQELGYTTPCAVLLRFCLDTKKFWLEMQIFINFIPPEILVGYTKILVGNADFYMFYFS